MEGTITGDARLRIWGWDRGRQAEYTRPDLPRAYQSWREILGESVQTLRVDIDRFFPGRGRIGLDGILSVVVPAGMLPNGAEDREPASSYLVARRVAWFGDVEDRRLSEMDLYVSIRESIEVHRRPTDALDRGLSPG